MSDGKLTFEEVTKELNNKKTYSVFDAEDLLLELIGKCEPVSSDQDVSRHRWYEISTYVYPVCGRYLAIRGACELKSEEGTFEDIGILSLAYEVFPVSGVVYVKKEEKK